jgi:hypothetical protein
MPFHVALSACSTLHVSFAAELLPPLCGFYLPFPLRVAVATAAAAAAVLQFAVLEIVWLADLLTSKQQQQQQQQPGSANGSSSSSVLSLVPGSVLSDAAAWLTFVIQQGQSEQLAAVPIGG